MQPSEGFYDNGKDCEPHSVMCVVEKLLRAFQTASCSSKDVRFGRRCYVGVLAGVKVTSVSCVPGRGIGGSGIVETQRLGSQLQDAREHTEKLPAQPEVHTRPDLRPS